MEEIYILYLRKEKFGKFKVPFNGPFVSIDRQMDGQAKNNRAQPIILSLFHILGSPPRIQNIIIQQGVINYNYFRILRNIIRQNYTFDSPSV